MNRSTLFIAAIVILLFSACKKNNDEPENDGGSARYNILTSGSWRVTAYYMDIYYGGVQIVDDLMESMQDCEKDNLYIFNKNGTLTLDEGPTKCNSAAPQQKQEGTWQLANNDTQLKESHQADDAITIVELTDATMRLSFQYTPEGEPTRKYSITYTHVK